MFTTTSIWVALPHGLTGPPTDRRVRLAVAVSLRLGSDVLTQDGMAVPLSSFPEAMNWAATVAGLQFNVEVGNGNTTAAQVVSAAPNPQLWQALFPDTAPVRLRNKVEPLASRSVNTFPNAKWASQLSTGYPGVFYSSPIGPPNHAVAQAFPELDAALAGVSDDGTARRERAALALDLGAVDDQELLASAHADLAVGLLGHSAAGSRTERLAAAIRIAQRMAQLRGGAYTPVIPDRGDQVSAFTQLLAFHRGPQALAAGQADHASPQAGPTSSAAPAVTGVNPRSGSGEDAVTITGAGFTGATAVAFGSSPASNVSVASDTQITCTSPAGLAAGPVHVTVATPAGTSVSSPADQFTYTCYDVHQAFSMLADYPLLLPMLGLVVELELPLSALLRAPLGAPQVLRANPADVSGASPPGAIVPWTAYTLEDPIFTPATKPAGPAAGFETTAGLLNLAQQSTAQQGATPQDTYELVQVDVDGAGLNTAAALAGTSGDASGLPSIRTAGISVSRLGYAQFLNTSFAAAIANDARLTNPDALTLYDVDVVRGYRVDIGDPTSGTWRSLHQRVGSYTFLAAEGGPLTFPGLADEGHAQPATADYPDQSGTPSTLHIHESLAHWQGWSLSVPRPGKTVGDQGPTDASNDALPQGFQLQTSFQVAPGTLPSLRYGSRYLVRVRTVDLAGNSLTVAEADDLLNTLRAAGFTSPLPVLPLAPPAELSSGLCYQRFEPVSAPVFVMREVPGEGESVDRLVLRSNIGEDTTACADRLRQATLSRQPSTARTGYLPVSERHVVPPKISHSAAEASGMFDSAFGPDGTPAAIYSIALRDGSLYDDSVVDIFTGEPVPIPDTTGIDPVTGDTATRPSVETVTGGGSAGAVLHHEDSLKVPYLPDRHARGAVLFGLPGLAPDQAALVDSDGNLTVIPTWLSTSTALQNADLTALGSMTQIGFGDNWPERLPFRLCIADPPAPPPLPPPPPIPLLPQPPLPPVPLPPPPPPPPPSPPQWDPAARVLTVFLPQADQVSVQVASFLLQDDVENVLGQWGWLVASLAAQTPPVTLDLPALYLAAAGALWLLTPARTVTLVHAVQQPLRAPAISAMNVLRGPGDTGIFIGGNVSVHGKSSAKIDLIADWQETADRLDEPAPRVLSFERHVYEVPIELPEDTPAGPVRPLARHPIATYDATTDTLTLIAPSSLPPPGVKPNGGGNGNGPPPKPPLPYTSRQEFSDTKHRSISYTAVATSRFREYFPPEVTTAPGALTVTGPATSVQIPSSAPAAAPRVVACLPTMRWERPAGPFGTRVRHGGGVRILLDRPWFSSGNGELLGIVLAESANYPPDDRTRSYISHWGNDPTWASNAVAPLSWQQFPTGQFADGLTLPELAAIGAPATVGVVGYEVQFDSSRGLWYADIQLDPGLSYRPLVRLAVARHQPTSVTGVELSPAVATDLVQLLPDRIVTVTQEPVNPSQIHLRVDGPVFTAGSWPGRPQLPSDAAWVTGIDPVPDLIQVSVEQRIPGGTDDAGWRQPAPADLGVHIAVSSAVLSTGATDPTAPLWDGTITLPTGFAPGDLRIVILEQEHLLTDRLQHYSYRELVNGEIPGGPKWVTTTGEYGPGDGHVVFAEVIIL